MTYNKKLFLLLFSISGIVFCFGAFPENKKIEFPEKASPNTFIVLELFTSQGCSSCPAADAQLRKVNEIARQRNLPIYTLSFHVDYWDHLGWKDCFSDQMYTARQYKYAHAFSKRNIYTPQMVANGTQEFVGSNESECENAVLSALHNRKTKNIKVKGHYKILNDMLEIRFAVMPAFDGYVNIALVQNESKIKIDRGENNGRIIDYTSIVRAFKQIDWREEKQGLIKLNKPQDLEDDNFNVIIYLQNKIDMKILGVTRASLI